MTGLERTAYNVRMIPIYPITSSGANQLSAAPVQGSPTLTGLKNPPPLSLYIHIPWCVKKCPYCDFNSHESKTEIPEVAYVDALIADLEQATPLVWGRKISSVFFGGGTPSLFSADAIDKILSHMRMLTPLEYEAEITLEANPGTVDIAHFEGYRQAGVNRVSLGIQSFDNRFLNALGRIHDSAQAKAAIKLAMLTFDSVNLDIMYALPGQTLAEALQDVNAACALNPSHLSFYHLTLEPNTPFHRTPPSLPDDDTSATMQEEIEKILAANGYMHYETSAFAKSGKQCQHNLNYWTFGDYLGIGAGAHSKLSFHDKIIRQARHKHPRRYMELAQQSAAIVADIPEKTTVNQFTGQPYIDKEWQIMPNELGFEFMMNALRLNQGFSRDLFEARTGLPWQAIHKKIKLALAKNFITVEGQTIKPTLLGRRFLNDLLGIFLD